MESKIKFLKKEVDVWEQTLTLHKKATKQGKYGIEAVTQYFPVKYQYKTFIELQTAIDNNLPPLQLVKVDSLFSYRDDDDYEHNRIDNEEFVKIAGIDNKIQRDLIRYMHANVGEFLLFYFTLYNKECVTIDNKGRTTCTRNKRRSLVDLYRVCKYYFPMTTVKEVKEALWDLPVGIDVFICPDIRRRVHRRNDPHSCSIAYNDADEFGWDYYCTNVQDSKYFALPYKELVKMINKRSYIHLSPVPLNRVNPDVIWYAGNNYKNDPDTQKQETTVEITVVAETETDELPF